MEAAMKLDETFETKDIETRALSVPEQAKLAHIIDNQTYERAAGILLTIKDIRKEIDATFDPIVKKAHEAHKEAVAQKKRVEAPLVEAEGILKPRIAAFHAEQERKRQQEENRLREEGRKREEEERLQAAIQAEQDGVHEEVEAILESPQFIPAAVVPSSTPKVAGISMRKVWKFRIVNPVAIPRQYLIPDEKAIGSVVRSLGERAKIPGIEIYFETNTAAGRR